MIYLPHQDTEPKCSNKVSSHRKGTGAEDRRQKATGIRMVHTQQLICAIRGQARAGER